MINKIIILKKIDAVKNELRADTELGMKCRDTCDLVQDYINHLPEHKETDLILSVSFSDCKSIKRKITEREKILEQEKNKKVYKLIEKLNENTENCYYFENPDMIYFFMKDLISKAPLETIGTTSYENNIVYLNNEDFLKITIEGA